MTVLALHIPDGFLSGPVAAGSAILALGAVALALRIADRTIDDAQVPLLGVVAAFVFVAQMLNFPVAGGTSGHVLGAALAAVLLGPWTACLVMTVVVATQALAFADGGVGALGANVLNLGVLGALVSGFLLAAVVHARPSRTVYLAAVGVAAWLAVMLAAVATSVELALSGTVPLHVVLPAMLGVHALIGVGEALVTVAAVSGLLAARPDLVHLGGRTFPGPGRLAPRPDGALT
ncbi:energy-coupling factor ABC transporter permease [Paraconexibacter sp.]|uniref:energy-coupling factor ABC transporter permease n=1 Tax=Paraconexibacter sp. TaxID=2949640 RepID=UPI003564EE11